MKKYKLGTSGCRTNQYESEADFQETRKEIVLRQAEQGAFLLRDQFIGKTLRALVEDEERGFGHAEIFLPVFVPKKAPCNTLVNVTCVENHPEGLFGKIVS